MAFERIFTFIPEFDATPPHQFLSIGGRCIFIGANFRPYQIYPETDQIFPFSITPPIYAVVGPPAYGSGTMTISFGGAGTGGYPGGEVSVREVFYRAKTDERSAGSFPAVTGTGAAGQDITIASNSQPWATAGDTGITAREFYVSYSDAPDNWYLWASVPITAGPDAAPAASPTFDELVTHRALETDQTGLFPAVSTATYGFGRLVGGSMNSRQPLSSSITLTLGSKCATMPAIGLIDSFRQSDTYRALTYIGPDATIGGRAYKKGEVLALIEHVMGGNRATIATAQGFGTADEWPHPTITLTNPGTAAGCTFAFMSRSKVDLFTTTVYAGEAGGGLSNEFFAWSPFNQMRDQAQYAQAGRLTFVGKAAGQIVAVYQKGMSLMSSEFSTDSPPRSDWLSLSDELGSFNPQAMFGTNDRTMYFLAQGRLFQISGSRIVDAGHAAGWASFFRKFIGVVDTSLSNSRVTFNPEGNRALILGLTRVGDASNLQKTYAAMLCFDQNGGVALCPLRWPIPVRTGAAVPREVAGVQFNQWFLGGANRIYTFGAPGVNADTYYDAGNNLHTATAISWLLKFGTRLFDWKAILKRIAVVFKNTDPAFSMSLASELFKDGDLGTSATGEVKTIVRAALCKDQPALYPNEVHAARLALSGDNKGQETKIFRVQVIVDPGKSPTE